jgi:transposase InsO family protein
LQGGLSVERMCLLAQVSRASFYRYLQRGWQSEEEIALRSAVQSIVLHHRWRYGYRRITAELRSRGMMVNHKRIARIMREDNLLAVRHEWQEPVGHPVRAVRIYLNLANRMTLLGPNQLWIADITYIRLAWEYVYLAVVLDAFSRRVIGWALGQSLKAQLAVCALEANSSLALSAADSGTSPAPFASSLRQSVRSRSRSWGRVCATISSRAVPFRRMAKPVSSPARRGETFGPPRCRAF